MSAAPGRLPRFGSVPARPTLVGLGLRARYRRRLVLDGVDLHVSPGEIVGVMGENGSGKSTLVRILAGVQRPETGAVCRRGTVGYAPQTPLLYDHLTVDEHFRYVAAARGLSRQTWTSRADRLLGFFRFAEWRDARAATLSEGTKQKLNLALALLAEPDVLLLDEPYSGLEWETYRRFWRYVRRLRDAQRAVVVVSHLFYERRRLDRVLELRDGVLREVP